MSRALYIGKLEHIVSYSLEGSLVEESKRKEGDDGKTTPRPSESKINTFSTSRSYHWSRASVSAVSLDSG